MLLIRLNGNILLLEVIFFKTFSVEIMSKCCFLIPDAIVIWYHIDEASLLIFSESKFIGIHHSRALVQLSLLVLFKKCSYGHRQIRCWVLNSEIRTEFLIIESKVYWSLIERVSSLVKQLVLAFVQIRIRIWLILLTSLRSHLTFLRLTHRLIRGVGELRTSLPNAKFFTVAHILGDIRNWILGC
jgi:hypothetical protein